MRCLYDRVISTCGSLSPYVLVAKVDFCLFLKDGGVGGRKCVSNVMECQKGCKCRDVTISERHSTYLCFILQISYLM